MRVLSFTVVVAVLLWTTEPALAQTSAPTSLPEPGAELELHDPALSAEEMAAVLFGRPEGRTRSIRMKSETGSEPGPGVLAFKVNFALDSARVDPAAHGLLDEVARLMALPEMDGRALVVEGHTDARGEDDYNDALSLRRANAVIAYLFGRHGVATGRLLPVGRGERELLYRDDPGSGANRRVQFYLPGAK